MVVPDFFTRSMPWKSRRLLPAVSAVYAFSSPEGELRYVGATGNLRNRMRQHHRENLMIDDAIVHWRRMAMSRVFEVEAQLIRELTPPWNGQKWPEPLGAPPPLTWNLREMQARSRVKSKDLAQVCGVAPETVARWRWLDRPPAISQQQIERICEAVKCSPAELLGLD